MNCGGALKGLISGMVETLQQHSAWTVGGFLDGH